MFSSSKSVVSDIQLRRDMDAALSTLLRIQEVIGVPEEEMKEKEMLELGKFKGDEFMLVKIKIMKRLEATQQAVSFLLQAYTLNKTYEILSTQRNGGWNTHTHTHITYKLQTANTWPCSILLI